MPTLVCTHSALSHLPLPWNLVMDNQCLPMGILPSWPSYQGTSTQSF